MKMKKTLVLTTTALTLLSVGIGSTHLGQVDQVSAATKKKSKKTTKVVKKVTNKKPAPDLQYVDKYSKWYARNAANLDDQYIDNDNYNNGYSDGRGTDDPISIDPTEMNTTAYRYGWILSRANNGNDDVTNDNPADYGKWREIYQQGFQYVTANNIQKNIMYQNGTWVIDHHFQSSYSPDFDWDAYN